MSKDEGPLTRLCVPAGRSIAPYLAGAQLAYVGLSFDGSPVIMSVSGLPDFRDESGMFVKTRFSRKHDYRIVRFQPTEAEVVLIPERDENFHFAQPLPNGNWLVVAARCHYNDGAPEKNAFVFDSSGTPVDQFCVGDGIQDVQVDKKGSIWISYFDEGVFGNYGWSTPIGASGLLRWRVNGEVAFEYAPPAGIDPIADCYALNVASDDIEWACYYTDFPLVRLRGGQVDRYWLTPGYGSRGLAVAEDLVVFTGSYRHREALYLCQLAETTVKELRRCVLTDQNKRELERPWAVARGDQLVIVSQSDLFMMNVRDFQL